MKVYRISKWTFAGICVLILALPVSRHWRLLLGGSTATGTVTEYARLLREVEHGRILVEYASEVTFYVEQTEYRTYGPKDLEYATGRTLKVRYDPADPARNCIVSLSGLYLRDYAILPMILLIVWYAFYLSFNNYYGRKKASKQEWTESGNGSEPEQLNGKL